MSSVNTIKDVLTHIDGDATLGAGWSILNGVLSLVSTGTDSTATLPTETIFEGRVYELHYNVTNTVLAAADTSVVAQIGGNGDYSFTENQVWNAAAPSYQICGSSVASGVQLTSVNATVGDTMDIEVVVCLITQFTDSTNLDSLFAVGDIRVPAGANQALALTDANWTRGTGWTIAGGIATSDGSQVGDSDLTATVAPLTAGKEQLQTYTITISAGTLTPVVGTALGTPRTTAATFTELLLSNGTALTFRASADFVGTITTISDYEMTAGPIDEYVDNGTTLNGETVYESVNTHAPGDGTADVKWFIWFDSSQWRFTKVAGSNPNPRWFRGSTGADKLIGDYGPSASPPPATGTATVSYGPTDAGGERYGSSGGYITSRRYNSPGGIITSRR